MMQPLTPEQVENQKIDQKAAEMQNKDAIRNDPGNLSPADKLRAILLPPRPKLTPQPTMKTFSNNGQLMGRGAKD